MQDINQLLSFSTQASTIYLLPNKTLFSSDVENIYLEDEEKSMYVALKHEKRKKEFLLIRKIRNSVFPGYTISYTEQGAPYFKNKKLHLSISHSKNYIALGVNPVKPIGIDLEEIQTKISRIYTKFMHPNEINQLKDVNDLEGMTKFWCAKESLYKMSSIEGLSFQNELPVFINTDRSYGKSLRISEKEIPLAFEQLNDTMLCYTY
jgi:phosphopantetheinyl transferase